VDKDKKYPTPYEFEYRIQEIINEYGDDTENCHAELDLYICETMEKLGYADGIRLFRKTPKWYA